MGKSKKESLETREEKKEEKMDVEKKKTPSNHQPFIKVNPPTNA